MLSKIEDMGAKTESRFSVSLSLNEGYQFEAEFGLPGVDALTLDEPSPLGEGAGPNPARLLTVAVANCLASSLLFCLRKAHIEVFEMTAFATSSMTRDERGRLRMTAIDVTLRPLVAASDQPRLARCLEIFEDYCPVTVAVRQGLAVRVNVTPSAKAA